MIEKSKSNILPKVLSTIFVFAFILNFTSHSHPVFAQGPCTCWDSKQGIAMPEGCDFTGKENLSECKPDGSTTNTPNGSTKNTPDGSTTNQINTHINNPLGGSTTDIPSFIKAILNFVVLIGVPIVTLAIIYSGFLFVTAQGNSEKLKKAKKTIIATLIGAALLLGCYVIAGAIQGTVDQITSQSQ